MKLNFFVFFMTVCVVTYITTKKRKKMQYFSKWKLHDIIGEQKKEKSSYYVLDSRYGSVIVSDQEGLVINKKTFIAKGVTLKVRATLTTKEKVINDGTIQVGKKEKNLVRYNVEGEIENNDLIENNGIMIITKTGSIEQARNGVLHNIGRLENNGRIDNSGTIKNDTIFDNYGTILMDKKSDFLNVKTGTFNQKHGSAFNYK
jgi:hypothetical protein